MHVGAAKCNPPPLHIGSRRVYHKIDPRVRILARVATPTVSMLIPQNASPGGVSDGENKVAEQLPSFRWRIRAILCARDAGEKTDN